MSEEMMGFDVEIQESEISVPEDKEPKRAPYAVWEVGGQEYKMKLVGRTICQLERKYRRNLLMIVSDDGLPPLETMLTMIQAGMQEYQHGLNFNKVLTIYDKYLEEGGNQTRLMTDVITPLMNVSGFFTDDQAETMAAEMENI